MIVAVTMARDEEDIVGWTVEQMLTQVDHVIAADNLSTDKTRAILESFGDRVTVIDDPDPRYLQADKMTSLVHRAGAMGAGWIIPFDADEAWWLPDLDTIDADVVTTHPVVMVPQHTDPADPNPINRMQWRLPDPEPQPKVLFRYHPDAALHMGQHDVSRPGRRIEAGECRHFQYRSLAQVRRKVTNGVGAYDLTGLSRIYGSHWRDLAAKDDEQLAAWWDAYTTQPLCPL